jgi:hypothetical protein
MDEPDDRNEPDVLEQVRSACAWVAACADLVRIDTNELAAFGDRLVDARRRDGGDGVTPAPDPWRMDPTATWSASSPSTEETDDTDETEPTVTLVLALDTINFGSGYHPRVRKRPGCSGAVTMATALREWAADRPVTAERLVRLTSADAHRIFGQPDDDDAMVELMAHFAAALHELGTYVLEQHGGRFVALVEAARGSAASLVGILGQLPHFRDESAYRGEVVPFYKRAQLAAADLDRAFGGVGPGRFTDLDRLTAFADNLVPHVLRVEGVLRYDTDLAAMIDRGALIPSGDPAEVEIRASGVHAVELLRADLATRAIDVRSSDLDALLWRRGGEPRYKAIPRHRARSVFY